MKNIKGQNCIHLLESFTQLKINQNFNFKDLKKIFFDAQIFCYKNKIVFYSMKPTIENMIS